jgi:protein O-mannosyl-transferase
MEDHSILKKMSLKAHPNNERINPGMKRYRNEIITCLLLIATTLAVFAQLGGHDFIIYDDPDYVTKNLEVQAGWTGKSFVWAFTDTVQGLWHPLTMISHMTDCQFFGLNPAGHHLSSLFLHITNTLLLFLALRLMTGALVRSAFVAALFALHPLHVETVAWIADRKDLLAAFFSMLGIIAYSYYSKHSGLWRYALVLFLFVLGLLSKAVVVTMPAVFLLLDYWPLNRLKGTGESKKDHRPQPDSGSFSSAKRSASALILEKVPFFILAAVFTLMTMWIMQTSITRQFATPKIMPSANPIPRALVFYVTYIAKMIWPVHLALPYPRPEQVQGWQAAGAAIILSTVSLFAFWKGRRYPYLPVGWLWYLLTLAPVIGLVKFGPHRLTDRYTYIPLVGLFLIIAWGLNDLMGKWRVGKTLLRPAAGVTIILLMGFSWVQAGYWKNNILLFQHALEVTADNLEAHNLLGVSLQRQGKLREAIEHLNKAVNARPDEARYQHNLGIALAKEGRLFNAVIHLSKAVQLKPDDIKAHHNLGVALALMGNFDRAIEQFKEAIRLKPDYAQAHLDLGNTLARMGKPDEAIAEFKEALRIEPGLDKARRNLEHTLELTRKSRRGSK